MKSNPFSKEQEQQEVEVLEKELHVSILYLFNDDFNSFEHVIECLVEILGHSEEQALQCAMLVHYKGKCDVKTGEYSKLIKPLTALLDKGLTAKII
ncbi:MAG: ATP-dependent Clp protease adaptor ClpS [Solirubrobacteraceae bacterium]